MGKTQSRAGNGSGPRRTASRLTCGWGSKSRLEEEPAYSKHDSLATIAKRTLPIEAANFLSVGEKLFNDRYTVHALGGCGAFGEVYFASDAESNDDVAIKVLPHDPFGGAQSESALLSTVRKADARGKCPIVRFDGLFRHKGLDCLVFERLGADMYEVLRATRHTGISLDDIRRVARCLLKAFVLLRQEDIVHCDVKPENILVARGLGSYASTKDVTEEVKALRVKLIDFGSARQSDQTPETYMQSRFYRAPDVMLGLRVTSAVDMWSLGCVLVELLCGDPLFPGQDSHEMLYLLELCLGPVPASVLREGDFVTIRQYYNPYTIETKRPVRSSTARTLRDEGVGWKLRPVKKKKLSAGASAAIRMGMPVAERVRASLELHGRTGEEDPEQLAQFISLVSSMLDYNLATRIRPVEALSHPFFSKPPARPAAAQLNGKAAARSPSAAQPIAGAGYSGDTADDAGNGVAAVANGNGAPSGQDDFGIAASQVAVAVDNGAGGSDIDSVGSGSASGSASGSGSGSVTSGGSISGDSSVVEDDMSVSDCAAPTPTNGAANPSPSPKGVPMSEAEKLKYEEARARRSKSTPGHMMPARSFSDHDVRKHHRHRHGHHHHRHGHHHHRHGHHHRHHSHAPAVHHHDPVPFTSTYASHMNARFMQEQATSARMRGVQHRHAHSLWSLERDIRDSRELSGLAATWRRENRSRRTSEAMFASSATTSAPLRHSSQSLSRNSTEPTAYSARTRRATVSEVRVGTSMSAGTFGSGSGSSASGNTVVNPMARLPRTGSASHNDLERLAHAHLHAGVVPPPPQQLALQASMSEGGYLTPPVPARSTPASSREPPLHEGVPQPEFRHGRSRSGDAGHLRRSPAVLPPPHSDRRSPAPMHGNPNGLMPRPSFIRAAGRLSPRVPIMRSTTPDTRGVGRLALQQRGEIVNMWDDQQPALTLPREGCAPDSGTSHPMGRDHGDVSMPVALGAIGRSTSAGGVIPLRVQYELARPPPREVPAHPRHGVPPRPRKRSGSNASGSGRGRGVADGDAGDASHRTRSSRSHSSRSHG